MITEVLLVLPLYLALFHLWLRFQHVIKMMTDVESILNHDEFFADPVDALKMVLAALETRMFKRCSKQRQSIRWQKAMDT